MAWPALRRHMYEQSAPLIPRLSTRQLAAALRAEVRGRDDEAIELLIAHGTWLSDTRLRRTLKGLWNADGDLTVFVHWKTVAHALGVTTELLHAMRFLNPPMRMWPYLDEWTYLSKPTPTITAAEEDRTEVAVLRAVYSLATGTPIGIGTLGERVHPRARAMIVSAITRTVAGKQPPITAEFYKTPPWPYGRTGHA
ncbi:hypothetical protein [Virgisporangium aliadipatigenens]|nr:hypothetical protein [Virgisporangium aliadipatigenens]